MNYYKQHQELLERVLLALQKKFPNGRFFTRQVGLFYTKNGSPVYVGVKGQADIWGYAEGLIWEIEIKTGKAVQSKNQKKWEEICKKMNVIYKVIRHEKEVKDLFPLK